MNIDRVRVDWVGFPGAPGVSTFYFVNGVAGGDALQSLFINLMATLPTDVHIHVQEAGDTVESTTGQLSGSWTGTHHDDLQGASALQYAAPVGYQLQWLTSSLHNGHRVRGRTYIVPASSGIFQVDGTIADLTLAAVQGFADTFVTAQADNFRILSRHTPATPSWTDVHGKVHRAKSEVMGQASPVLFARVPDKAIVLRSRRD